MKLAATMIPLIFFILILNTNFIGDVFSAYVDKETGLSRNVRSIYMEIPKCCAKNQVIVMDYDNYTVSCEDYSLEELSFTNLNIYDKVIHEKQINKTFSDIFRVIPDKRPNDTALQTLYVIAELMLQPYLSEVSKLPKTVIFFSFFISMVNGHCRQYLQNETF